MLSSDKNIEIIARLINNLKHYGELRIESLQLDLVQKIALLVSALVVGGVVFCLLSIVMVLLALFLVAYFTEQVGAMGAYTIVIAIYLLLALLVYAGRRKYIVDPVVAFMMQLFLSPSGRDEEPLDHEK